MEVTLDLDDDLYELASAYAAARDIALGEAICELVRQPAIIDPPSQMQITENGLTLLLPREDD